MGFLQRLLSKPQSISTKRYAVEVHPDYVDSFSIPTTRICEAWKNADGSATFILESEYNISNLAKINPGVRGISEI